MSARQLACMFCVVIAGVIAISTADEIERPVPKEPEYVEMTDLKPELDGKDVTMSFKVQGTYWISGSVLVGAVPSFGIRPEMGDASRFGVLVSGELADLMDRFGLRGPMEPAKGLTIHASGKITVFPPQANATDRRPSYQLNIREWKKFRIVPNLSPPKPE